MPVILFFILFLFKLFLVPSAASTAPSVPPIPQSTSCVDVTLFFPYSTTNIGGVGVIIADNVWSGFSLNSAFGLFSLISIWHVCVYDVNYNLDVFA